MAGLISSVGRSVLFDYGRSRAAANEPALGEAVTYLDSGTSALALAAMYAIRKSGYGREAAIVLPAYCCPDVLSAVRKAGATPVLVDLQPGTTWLDHEQLRDVIAKQKVAAAIAVNFMGIPERIAELQALAAGSACTIIDDSCQAPPGAADKASADVIRIFSFGRGKPVSMLHGGAVQWPSEPGPQADAIVPGQALSQSRLHDYAGSMLFNLARRPAVFRLVSTFGLAGKTVYKEAGDIRAMREFHLSRLPAAIEAYWSREPAAQAQLIGGLAALSPVDFNLPSNLTGNRLDIRLLRLPLLFTGTRRRDEALRTFRSRGIDATTLYGRALPGIAGVDLGLHEDSFPAAKELSRKLLTLPLHSDISSDIVDRILRILAKTPI